MGYALTFIIVASIVIVGLLVYYVGVMSVTHDGDTCLATTVSDSTTSKPKKEKVCSFIKRETVIKTKHDYI